MTPKRLIKIVAVGLIGLTVAIFSQVATANGCDRTDTQISDGCRK